VRRAVREALGADVARAARVWGGYSPAPTFRLRLVDGRRAFVKAVGPADNDFAQAAFSREARFYAELSDLIAPWAPDLLGAFEHGGWRGLLLEDLGPKSVPPWSVAAARGIARAYAEFHLATADVALPEWAPPPATYLHREARGWTTLVERDEMEQVAGLAGERAGEAKAWLRDAVSALAEASRRLVEIEPPYALLHGDTRSDNLRWRDGRLYLFDWPHAGAGPAEWDLAAFAQSIPIEGGPEPEQFVAWYAERAPVRNDALDASVVGVAGFFAGLAWQPEIPGLPRLRPFQRAQLRVSLAWAARRLRLPNPAWLDGVEP
jgi:hypothetical protein